MPNIESYTFPINIERTEGPKEGTVCLRVPLARDGLTMYLGDPGFQHDYSIQKDPARLSVEVDKQGDVAVTRTGANKLMQFACMDTDNRGVTRPALLFAHAISKLTLNAPRTDGWYCTVEGLYVPDEVDEHLVSAVAELIIARTARVQRGKTGSHR